MITPLLPLLAQWILLSNHAHTVASPDSSLRVADLDRMAKDRGVQAVVVTDHNTVRAALDPDFHATGSVTFIEGQEWGEALPGNYWGHVGLIGLRGHHDVSPALDLSRMFAEAAERGALGVINHPFSPILGWRTPEVPPGAGGVEVWNQAWGAIHNDNPRALAWWDAALRSGRRLVAVGGADVHGMRFFLPSQPIDSPVNLVWAEDASADRIMAALHAGRVLVARSVEAPRLELRAEVGGHEAFIGDQAEASGPVPLRVRVSGGRDLRLSLHTRAGKIYESLLESDDATVEAEVAIGAGPDFVRAELREAAGWPAPELVVLANPIYFNR